jgi:hypothetical protein
MSHQQCITDVRSLMAVPLQDLAHPAHLQPLLEFAGNSAPACVAQALLRFSAAQCLAALAAIALIACDIACYWAIEICSISLDSLRYQMLCLG